MGVKNILMLSSYLDAVRITIIKEIEQDIEGIRRFDKLFSREKNKRNQPLTEELLSRFNLSRKDWFAIVDGVSSIRTDIAHPGIIDQPGNLLSFVRNDAHLSNLTRSFGKIFNVLP